MIVVFLVWFLPESPRWLLMANKGEKAREALAILRGLPQDSEEVRNEIAGIEHSLETTANTGAKLSQILKMGEDKLLYRFGLCILLQFYQQIS